MNLQETQNKLQALAQGFIQIYHKALQYSNLQVEKHLLYRNVPIYQGQYIHEVYTKSSPNLPHLVLLHGYGGTSLTFVRTFQHLYQDFQVHAIDTYGVGLSSRGKWSDKLKPEQVGNYYVDAIQQWRKQVGIQNFILAGHSFGGYLSTIYLEKYPNNVKQLLLLSPVGSGKINEQTMRERRQNRKMFFCIAQKIYNMNFRPSRIMNACWIGNKFIDKILNNRLKLPEGEQQIWKKYLKFISKQKQSSEVGFYTLFGWPLQPVESIQQKFQRYKPKIKIDFMFGDNDWMNEQGAKRLIEKYRNMNLHRIGQAGHQLIFDNPLQVTKMIKNLCK